MTKKDVNEGVRTRDVSLKPFEAPKVQEITQTSPWGQRENHERYSPLVSAATRSSCEAMRGEGQFLP